MTDIPSQPAGAILVAVVDGHHERLPGRSQLRGDEAVLVNASSIMVIDGRPGHLATVPVEIPSRDPGEVFTVSVTFRCGVVDPLVVARSAPRDLIPTLRSFLRSDSKLITLGQEFATGDQANFARHVRARVVAACHLRPPTIDGLEIELGDIEVVTPEDLRRHIDDLRKERFRQELERLKSEFTFEQGGLLEAVINRGPAALEALYLRLGEARYGEATNRAYGRQADRLTLLREMIGSFAERGHFDNVALDTQRLVDDFVSSVLGPGNHDDTPNANSYVLTDDESGRDENGQSGLGRPDPPGEGDGKGAPEDVLDRPDEPPEEDPLGG